VTKTGSSVGGRSHGWRGTREKRQVTELFFKVMRGISSPSAVFTEGTLQTEKGTLAQKKGGGLSQSGTFREARARGRPVLGPYRSRGISQNGKQLAKDLLKNRKTCESPRHCGVRGRRTARGGGG